MENIYNRDLVVTNKDNINLQNTENNYDRELLMKSLSSPKKEYRSIPFSQSTPDMPYQKVLFEDNPNQFVSPTVETIYSEFLNNSFFTLLVKALSTLLNAPPKNVHSTTSNIILPYELK